jgi:class 3 adenylate cyclase
MVAGRAVEEGSDAESARPRLGGGGHGINARPKPAVVEPLGGRQSGIVTFLLTDIKGSTRHWQDEREAMRTAIERHDALMTHNIEAHGGTVLTERGEGDSFFAVFGRASEAVAAACAAQRAIFAESWPTATSISVRMAIHTGEASSDYRGSVVNRCARLRAIADGGDVLVSATVHDLSEESLPGGVALRYVGEHRLRDLDRPERVFKVVDNALPVAADLARRRTVHRWSLLVAVAITVAAAVALTVTLHGRGSSSAPHATGAVITTIAGTGSLGTFGDGGLATAAELSAPMGLTVDASGDIFVVDGCRLRRISAADGTIDAIAGTGDCGFAGDGGSAILAQLNQGTLFGGYVSTTGIAVDRLGNVYVADTDNNRVRKIDPLGRISTVAGGGDSRSTGGSAGDGGPATSALLAGPSGLAIDDLGDLFIADTLDNRIRMVDNHGTISTVAGTGVAGFGGDNGPALQAQLSSPQGLAFDPAGDLYVADGENHRVRKLTRGGVQWMITTVAGDGQLGDAGDGGRATLAELDQPIAVAAGPGGVLFIADGIDNRLREVDAAGNISTIAGTGALGFGGDGGAASSAILDGPNALALDAAGDLLVSDTFNYRIRRITTGSTR